MIETDQLKEAVLSYERVRPVASATADEQDRRQEEMGKLNEHNTDKAKAAAKKLFNATSKQLGQEAVKAAEKAAKKQVAEAVVNMGRAIKDRYST